MSDAESRAVVVTGCSSGVGHALAGVLAERGYTVFAGVRKPEDAEMLRRESNGRIRPLMLDITEAAHVDRARRDVEVALGPERGLWALVNNAGTAGAVAPVECLAAGDWRRLFEVNLIGSVDMMRTFLPLLRKGRGRILIVGSAAGVFPQPFFAPYCASKAAIDAMADGLRREQQLTGGVPVALVESGFIRTPMWTKGKAEMDAFLAGGPAVDRERYGAALRAGFAFMMRGEKWGTPPEQMARKLVRILERRRLRPRYAAGAFSRIAMMAAWIPTSLVDAVTRLVLGRGTA
jgi:NAD(P)-dependent dehydrogenase (short-subunit alcohol dehydrogenase family)